MSIVVTEQFIFAVRRDKQINIFGQAVSRLGETTMAIPSMLTSKGIVPFTATATPLISDYQANYAPAHGQYPNARLIWIDGDGNWNEWMQSPKFNLVDGLVDSISWDLGEALSGFIIIN